MKERVNSVGKQTNSRKYTQDVKVQVGQGLMESKIRKSQSAESLGPWETCPGEFQGSFKEARFKKPPLSGTIPNEVKITLPSYSLRTELPTTEKIQLGIR